MKKFGFLILITVAYWLSACGGQGTPVAVAPSPTSAQAVSASGAQLAKTEVAPTATGAISGTKAISPTLSAKKPSCKIIEIPADTLVKPPSADDWSKGKDKASIVLIEYGDFQ